MKHENELLSIFIDKNNDKRFREPFFVDGYVYATDGKIMLRVKAEALSELYKESGLTPGRAMADMLNSKNCEHLLRHDAISAALSANDDVDYEAIEVECDECRGSGYVDWEYEDKTGEVHNMADFCPVCDGRGLIKTKDVSCFVCIRGTYFRGYYLHKIQQAMDLLCKESVLILNLDTSKAMRIVLDEGIGAEIYLMPCIPPETGAVEIKL